MDKIVVCVKRGRFEYHTSLELGKKYLMRLVNNNTSLIFSLDGSKNLGFHHTDFFKSVKEHREHFINSIINEV